MIGPGETIRVRSFRYDKSINKEWTANVEEINGSLIVLSGRFATRVEHPVLGIIEAGTMTVEYFWTDRWYNLFRFLDDDGSVKLDYFNIATPAVLSDRILDFVDLDLDLVVRGSGRIEILDEEEFRLNSIRFGYDAETVHRAHDSLKSVKETISSNGIAGILG